MNLTYPVIIREDDVDVHDGPSLVRCQDVPFAVGGAVHDRVVVPALPKWSKITIKYIEYKEKRRRQFRTAQGYNGTVRRRFNALPLTAVHRAATLCTRRTFSGKSIELPERFLATRKMFMPTTAWSDCFVLVFE